MYQQLTIQEFDTFFKILEEHFPKDEVKEYSFLKSLFERGVTKAIVQKEGDKIIGSICYMEVASYIFIDYFVIVTGFQGKRLGEQMLQYFKETINKPILLEVELPTNDISKRRIRFYQRQGFYLHDYEYIIPPIRSLKYPLSFLLMSYPNVIKEEEYQDLYPRILKTVYEIDKI